MLWGTASQTADAGGIFQPGSNQWTNTLMRVKRGYYFEEAHVKSKNTRDLSRWYKQIATNI